MLAPNPNPNPNLNTTEAAAANAAAAQLEAQVNLHNLIIGEYTSAVLTAFAHTINPAGGSFTMPNPLASSAAERKAAQRLVDGLVTAAMGASPKYMISMSHTVTTSEQLLGPNGAPAGANVIAPLPVPLRQAHERFVAIHNDRKAVARMVLTWIEGQVESAESPAQVAVDPQQARWTESRPFLFPGRGQSKNSPTVCFVVGPMTEERRGGQVCVGRLVAGDGAARLDLRDAGKKAAAMIRRHVAE